jgi:hypothetical protein
MLDERHLIFKTSIAQFPLGLTAPRTERLWRAKGEVPVPADESYIYETELLNRRSQVVGRVVLPDRRRPPVTAVCDFVVISEAQFFGDEERVDVNRYRLYNVMTIEWDSEHRIASRLALGRVYKHA